MVRRPLCQQASADLAAEGLAFLASVNQPVATWHNRPNQRRAHNKKSTSEVPDHGSCTRPAGLMRPCHALAFVRAKLPATPGGSGQEWPAKRITLSCTQVTRVPGSKSS